MENSQVKQRKFLGIPLPARRKWTKRDKANFKIAMLFLSPWIIGFVAFTLYPMIVSLYYSFTIYHSKIAPEWVGLQNYADLHWG